MRYITGIKPKDNSFVLYKGKEKRLLTPYIDDNGNWTALVKVGKGESVERVLPYRVGGLNITAKQRSGEMVLIVIPEKHPTLGNSDIVMLEIGKESYTTKYMDGNKVTLKVGYEIIPMVWSCTRIVRS